MSDEEEQEIISPREAKSWADIFKYDSDNTDEPLNVHFPQRDFRVDEKKADVVTTCCYSLGGQSLPQALWLSEKIPRLQDLDCMINCSREYVNFSNLNFDSLDENSRLNLLDGYMRMRHDLLSSKLMDTLDISYQNTDVKFCDVLPISSTRTPDFILKLDNSFLVIEVTAVSNPERAYKKKGHVGKGYEPKYQREIEEVRAQGHTIHYSVVVFDMSDPENNDHSIDIAEIAATMGKTLTSQAYFDLDYLRRELITQTVAMLNEYAIYLGILYGTTYSLHTYGDLEKVPIFGQQVKPYTGNYSRIGVSNFIFDKVVSIAPKLSVMLSRFSSSSNPGVRLRLTFEQLNSTFKFKKSKNGSSMADWDLAINNLNYSWICSHLDLELKGQLMKLPKADFEFMSYDKGGSRQPSTNLYTFPDYNPDHSKCIVVEEAPIKDFSSKVNNLHQFNLTCKFEDEDMEDRLLDSISNMDVEVRDEESLMQMTSMRTKKPLCHYRVSEDSFKKALQNFSSKMIELNSSSGEVAILHHVKPPFQYPLAQIQGKDYIDYRKKPSILSPIIKVVIGDYTAKALSFASSPEFSFGSTASDLNVRYEKAKRALSDYHKGILAELKELHKSNPRPFFPRLSELDNAAEHHSKLRELNNDLLKAAAEEGITNKNLGVINMGRGKKSQAEADFKREMTHFRTKESKAHKKGIGNDYNMNNLTLLFDNIKRCLLSPSDASCPEMLYDPTVAEDAKLLKQMKVDIVARNSSYYEHLRSTNLYHACNFISRLCHTLMFHSQSSINSSKVVVDNLGYDSVLLLIRGGKKIFTTKRSKLFRLIFPTFPSCADSYTGYTGNTNFSRHTINSRTYLISPWLNMHETLIADGITFLHRNMGFALLNRTPELDNDANLNRVYFNIILSIHNRRQTEAMLHNLRYLFMNCMSEVSAIEDILPEIAGFNYDYFQAWIRGSLQENFLAFATKLKELHDSSGKGKHLDLSQLEVIHPFNGHQIPDYTTLALGIYSSYLMSKAPTTQLLEQVKNLKSIMLIHDEFKKDVRCVTNCFQGLQENFVDYYDNLAANDFNFDPSYCFLLGKFMGDYLLNLEKKSKIVQKWDNILERPWDEMANTKGLRGNDQDFFGNKGYYVVYDEVIGDGKLLEDTMKLLASDATAHEKETIVNKTNETFRDRIASKPLNGVVFHVVDKVQRGGSREIYVMDMETKVHQQVIEDYTKYLCRLVPNEMISIPSNKRLSTIHTRVFEGARDNNEKYYWVLDCRKWAPKSVVEKFMVFLMGAKGALPETFVVHCLNFFSMMLNKKVYTRPQVVEVLTKSATNSVFKQYFKYDESKKAYYFEMEYSWVMGIFNYFSSLMHVANQMHASHIIRLSAQRNLFADNILHMVAHSDDSAGKIMVNNKFQMLRASFIYETLMHAANHLLSKKKCNQGKVYYEFLSILYIGGTLLSLLSKFTGIFNYHPTDKGYCADITDAYSKSTELLLNGGTFEQSYLALKVQAMLIYRFYFGRNINEGCYKLPPSMFGMPDAHPLMALLCGSDADLFRIYKTSSEEEKKLIVLINKHLIPLDSESTGLLRSFQCTPRVSLNNKLRKLCLKSKLPEGFLESWTLKNVKFQNTRLNAAQFLSKLRDKSFIAALQDETLTRRLSRSYYFRSNLTVHTSYGDMKPKDLKELMFLIKRTINGDLEGVKPEFRDVILQVKDSEDFITNVGTIDKIFNFLYSEVCRLYSYLDKIHYNPESVVENFKTCKPVYISVQKTLEECPTNYNPQSLCSWIKEPNMRNLLPDTRGYLTASRFVTKALDNFELKIDDLNNDQLNSLLQKMKQKSKSEYFCYSNLPWDLREISTYQDVLNFLSHNTFPNKMIRGLAIQYSKTMTTPIENITADLSNEDLQISLTLFILANALMSSPDFQPEMLDVDMHFPDFIGGGIGSFGNMLNFLIKYWGKQHNTAHYLQCLTTCVSELLMGNKGFSAEKVKDTYMHSFVKRQFLVDNVWLGQGKLFISLGRLKILMQINNIRVSSILVQTHEEYLEDHQVHYINICLTAAQLPKLQESMVQTEIEDWGCLGLCYDAQGNYYIGDAHGSLRFIPAHFDLNLGTPLSQLEKGRVKSFKGSKLMWEAVLDEERHSFQLSTLPVETQNAAVLLRGMLVENIKNKRILDASGGEAVNLLVEVCAKELDLERHIDPVTMMKNYHLTDIFKVIKYCHSRSLCKSINPELRVVNFPASDGGLLNCFIQYSKAVNTFDFKWQRHISPEFMALKSSQPESFVSEVVSTVKSKYDSLYTNIDKESIHRSLMKLSGADPGQDLEKDLMDLLCTWGYTGVAGALEELSGSKKVENFNKIRCYDPKEIYVSFFKDLFIDICIPMMLIYKNGLGKDGFMTLNSFGCSSPVNGRNINYYIMDVMHQTVLATYGKGTRDRWISEEQQSLLQAMVSSVLLHPETRKEFEGLVRSIAATRSLPVDDKTIKEWRIFIRTVRECYIRCNQRGHYLDYNVRKDLSSNLINPYVITRDALAKHGLRMKSMRLFHYGALSTHLYDTLAMNFTEDHKGKKLWFKIKMVSLEELYETPEIPFNHLAFPPKRFNEEFLESDEYDEVRSEYQGNEPDTSYINEVIEGYEEENGSAYMKTNKKYVNIVVNGRLTNVLKVDLPILILMGGSINIDHLSHIRMLGEDVLVVSNCNILRLFFTEGIMTFRSRVTSWSGHSILNPRATYYHVISRDINDQNFWMKVLEADAVGMRQVSEEIGGDYMLMRNARGVVQNENELMSAATLWANIDNNIRAKEAEEAEEEETEKMSEDKVVKQLDEEALKMKNDGLDDDQVKKYRRLAQEAREAGSWSSFFNALSEVKGNDLKQIKLGNIEKVIGSIIENPKTAVQHEMIMQAPLVFGGGRSKGQPKKSNLFRERKIIAELESLSPGLIWQVLSGSLHISQNTYDMFKKQIEMYKMMARYSNRHKQGKQFIVNLCMLILNDAVILTNPKNDLQNWRTLTSSTLSLMLLDEDKEQDESWDFQDEDSEIGVLRYGISGSNEER